jgi:hypothetical protein
MAATLIRQSLSRVVRSVSNRHRPDGRPNVLIFTAPRSGLTWLMELIASQPGFKHCNEPLDLRHPDVVRGLGIREWNDLYSRSRDEHALRILEISRWAAFEA